MRTKGTVTSLSSAFSIELIYSIIHADAPWVLARARLGQVEYVLHFLHCLWRHAVWLAAHVACAHIYVCGLTEHVCLVEGIHDVLAYSYCAVFLPQNNIVFLYVFLNDIYRLYFM